MRKYSPLVLQYAKSWYNQNTEVQQHGEEM